MHKSDLNGGEVVPLRPFQQSILFPALGRVESYWEGLRNGRLMPARAEIDPRGISDALQYAFVLEKLAPGLAKIRLAGMHLNTLMSMEVRGMPVSTMFLPEARRELERALASVLGAPAAVRLSLTGEKGFGRSRLDGQMLLLPVRDDRGAVTRVLGALETRGKVGRAPRRFSIRDIETKPLTADPLAAPRPRPGPKTEALSPRAEARKPQTESGGSAPGNAYLKLVYDAGAGAGELV